MPAPTVGAQHVRFSPARLFCARSTRHAKSLRTKLHGAAFHLPRLHVLDCAMCRLAFDATGGQRVGGAGVGEAAVGDGECDAGLPRGWGPPRIGTRRRARGEVE